MVSRSCKHIEIKKRKNMKIESFKSFNEKKSEKFQDIQIGDMFLRFGINGQLWKKISDRHAEFIKNVGKETAKYDKKPGSVNVFPQTMDVTAY